MSGGLGFPAVVAPSFPDESPHDDHLREGHPEVDDPPSPLGAPEELSVGDVPGIGALDDPALRGPKRGRPALLGFSVNRSTPALWKIRHLAYNYTPRVLCRNLATSVTAKIADIGAGLNWGHG